MLSSEPAGITPERVESGHHELGARLAARLLGAAPPSRLLISSDFDGTLAPIVSEPSASSILPDALAALRALVAARVKVAVISGRSRPALERLVAVPGALLL